MISAAESVASLPRWEAIDTVLLDMDGTLLDLRFDNYFWLHLVPERYAAKHDLTLEEARAVLAPMFAGKQGTLDWYCTDFWSRALSLDIAGMKHDSVVTKMRKLDRREGRQLTLEIMIYLE